MLKVPPISLKLLLLIAGKKFNDQSGTFSFNPAIPPISGEETTSTARIIQPAIAITNCTTSVIATPHKPLIPEYNIVISIAAITHQ